MRKIHIFVIPFSISKSLVNSLNCNDADSFSIQIEINSIPKIKTVTAKQRSVCEDTRIVSETSRAFNKTIMEG